MKWAALVDRAIFRHQLEFSSSEQPLLGLKIKYENRELTAQLADGLTISTNGSSRLKIGDLVFKPVRKWLKLVGLTCDDGQNIEFDWSCQDTPWNWMVRLRMGNAGPWYTAMVQRSPVLKISTGVRIETDAETIDPQEMMAFLMYIWAREEGERVSGA